MDLDQSRVLNLNLHQLKSLKRITDQFISNQFSRHNEFPLSLCIHVPISVLFPVQFRPPFKTTSTSRSRTCVRLHLKRREFRGYVMITGAKTISLLTREQAGANEKKNLRAEGEKKRSEADRMRDGKKEGERVNRGLADALCIAV